MTMNNKKRNYLIISIIVAVIVIIIASVFLTSRGDIKYFYDGDLGVIELKIKNIGTFNFIKQTTFDPFTTIELGNSVELRNEVEISLSSNSVGEIRTSIFKDGEHLVDIDNTLSPPVEPGEWLSTSYTYTPTELGLYTAQTYIRHDSTSEWVRWTDPLEGGDYGDVVIVEAQTECDDDYWSAWEEDEDSPISNGIIQIRDFIVHNDECGTSIDRSEYRTECDEDNNYVITGTSDVIGSGKLTCSLGNDENQTGCNADVIITCPIDNSTIITKKCTNGNLSDTGNVCSNDTGNGGGGGNGGGELMCWQKGIPEESIFSTVSICDSIVLTTMNICNETLGYYSSETKCIKSTREINWITWSIIGGVVLVVIVFIIIISIRMTRK